MSVNGSLAFDMPQNLKPFVFKGSTLKRMTPDISKILQTTNRNENVEEISKEILKEISSETSRSFIFIEGLFLAREPLIRQRNALIDSPFYLFRKNLQKKVAKIDVELDELDLEIWHHRKDSLMLEKEFIEEMRETNCQLEKCLHRLENKLND